MTTPLNASDNSDNVGGREVRRTYKVAYPKRFHQMSMFSGRTWVVWLGPVEFGVVWWCR